MNCLSFTFYFRIVFAVFIFVRFFSMLQNSSEIYSRTATAIATAAAVALVAVPATYSTFNNIDLNGVSLIPFNKVRVVYNVPCMEWERWSWN